VDAGYAGFAGAVVAFAPGGGGRGGEYLGTQRVVEGAAGIGADNAGEAHQNGQVVLEERGGDGVGFVERGDAQFAAFSDAAEIGVEYHDVVRDQTPIVEQVVEAGIGAGGEEEDDAAGA